MFNIFKRGFLIEVFEQLKKSFKNNKNRNITAFSNGHFYVFTDNYFLIIYNYNIYICIFCDSKYINNETVREISLFIIMYNYTDIGVEYKKIYTMYVM